jgi:ParB family chromosome partitioning protein
VPSPSRTRRTIEDLEASAEIFRPVQDRLAYSIAVDQVRPSARNPRVRLDGLDELAASLHEYGLLQPVVVRRVPGGYELIAGHRRHAAARDLGWTEIPAIVRDESDDDQAYLLTLTENLQREDLSPREEATALEVLLRQLGSTRKVANAIHKSAMYVSRRLRVFEDPALAPLVLKQQLRVSSAEELLRAPDDQRQGLATRAAAADWTPAEARREVANARRNGPLQQAPAPRLASHIRALSNELEQIDLKSLNARTRREAIRLLQVLQPLVCATRAARPVENLGEVVPGQVTEPAARSRSGRMVSDAQRTDVDRVAGSQSIDAVVSAHCGKSTHYRQITSGRAS